MTSKNSIEYDVVYGQNCSGELLELARGKRVLLVTDPRLWELYGSRMEPLQPQLVMAQTMEASKLENEHAALEPFDVAIGLGGGMAMDIAKYHAWKSQRPLFQVPTAISVDAMFSYPIALRIDGKVQYVGQMFPHKIYCDFDILQSAPPVMNRSGVCDLLSCHTALFDWRLAVAQGRSQMDETLYQQTAGILQDVKNNMPEVYAVSQRGIRMLMEGFRFVAVENYRVGHCQYEEGSEHFFYYCLEALTRKHFLHGKVINLGILLMSLLQDNDVAAIKSLIKQAGVPIHPASMDISYDDVCRALRACNAYVEEKGYSYSILNERPITEDFIQQAIETLRSEFDPDYSHQAA
ncbi:MAG: iron-containing alcohol dehydrogenase [Pirellulaceae bacterium]|nr:iron-containing alcohol dehydrogenase [Pirellulaceae bacterium]